MNTERTTLFYMANLGSEISRTLLEYEQNNFERMRASILRAEDIIAKIKEFPEMEGRTGELDILKSIIEDLKLGKFEINKKELLDYFSPFATRLMSQVG
ncbi:MAG: hypothetical protein LiPW15_505 [Parcubacteria group bacterium LiPW_15]|nr:MAG: hypothetical protein LiPW15_505 [Parcubacteria group bacterium LiPW_15]